MARRIHGPSMSSQIWGWK